MSIADVGGDVVSMTRRVSAGDEGPRSGSRVPWAGILACPRCRLSLVVPVRCEACGAEFGVDDGTPVLSLPSSRREFALVAGNSMWSDATRTLERVLHDPHSGARPRGLPYHVDAAHAAEMSRLPAGSAVLEVGCGGGQCRPWFGAMGHRYLGVDVSKTRVYEWLQKFGGPDILCDAHFLPFRDRSFDLVYCAAVFEHLACPPLAMAEIFRVLKPGGVFCGNASFMEPWHDSSFFHLSPLGAVALLQQAGFEPKKVWPGRGYSGFKAMAAMGFKRPFSWFSKPLGVVAHALYDAQSLVRNARRRSKGAPAPNPLLDRFRVAGATDWIAVKPARPRSSDALMRPGRVEQTRRVGSAQPPVRSAEEYSRER